MKLTRLNKESLFRLKIVDKFLIVYKYFGIFTTDYEMTDS
jgi:hypothetical protein